MSEELSYGIILAAGQSSRMGRDKASLPWLGGSSLLSWTVEALAKANWKPIVVAGPHNHEEWKKALPGITVLLNTKSLQGKTTSIARGLKEITASASAVLIASIDQPRPPVLYSRLRKASEAWPNSVIVPDKLGRNGHPIVLTGDSTKQLSSLSESNEGLRGFLRENQAAIHRIPCDPQWLQWDFNTPEAYTEAFEWFRSNSSEI